MKKIAVFASGGGSNLQSLIDACESERLKAQIALVLSNNSKSGALERARKHNIPGVHFSGLQFESPAACDSAMPDLLKKHKIDIICLAGYMKLLPKEVVRAFRGRILNIHPALLPKYGGKGMYGMHVHEAVVKAGEKESGATVHLVTEAYDEGPIVVQERVEVQDTDTPEDLAKKVLAVEHKIYPEAVDKVISGKVTLD